MRYLRFILFCLAAPLLGMAAPAPLTLQNGLVVSNGLNVASGSATGNGAGLTNLPQSAVPSLSSGIYQTNSGRWGFLGPYTGPGQAGFSLYSSNTALADFNSTNIAFYEPVQLLSTIQGNGSLLTSLNASSLASGTVATARLPGVLPVVDVSKAPFNADITGIIPANGAFQLAQDTACFTNGSATDIYVPPGDYLLTNNGVKLRGTFGGNVTFGNPSTMTNGYRWLGAQGRTSRIHYTNWTGTAFHYDDTDSRILGNVTLENLTILGPSGSPIPNTNITAQGIVFGAACGGNLNKILGCQIVGFKDAITMTGQVDNVVAGNLSVSNWNTFLTGAHLDTLHAAHNEILLGNDSGDKNSWSNSLAAYAFYPDNGSNSCLGAAAGAGAVIDGGECGSYPYYTYNVSGQSFLEVRGGNCERVTSAGHYISGGVKTRIGIGQNSIVNTNLKYFVICTNGGATGLEINMAPAAPLFATSGTLILVQDNLNNYVPPVFSGASPPAQPAITCVTAGVTNLYNIPSIKGLFDVTGQTLGTIAIPQITLGTNYGAIALGANKAKQGWILGTSYGSSAPDTAGMYWDGENGAAIGGVWWDGTHVAPQYCRFGVAGTTSIGWIMTSGGLHDAFGSLDIIAGGNIATTGGQFNGNGAGLTNLPTIAQTPWSQSINGNGKDLYNPLSIILSNGATSSVELYQDSIKVKVGAVPIASIVASVGGQNFDFRGAILLSTNCSSGVGPVGWPATPSVTNGAAIVMSNATVYILTSAYNTATWGATNKLAGP